MATRALVLRLVPYGEADLIVTLFTEKLGKVSGIAKHARRGRTFVLEPMHTLDVTLEDRAGADLLPLRSASVARVRSHLLTRLDALEGAGRALRWLRSGASRVPEPAVWSEMERVLDALDAHALGSIEVILGGAVLRVLAAFGWGFSLDACVVCGAPCSTGKAALIDPGRGGVVCRACGGGPHLARADVLARGRAALAGDDAALDAASAALWLAWGEQALAVHGAG